MNIRKFIARNSGEAMKMVKKEMGDDAVILRTRTVPYSGGDAENKGQGIEVTAAVDYDIPGGSKHQPVMDVNEEIRELNRELKEIKEAILFSDATDVLTPEFYFDRDIREKYNYLKTLGINRNLIGKIMSESRPQPPVNNQNKSHLLQESLLKVMTKIKIDFEKDAEKGQKIYTFIGPTGVGKTTTLAKLAAQSAINRGMKTAMITLDTFRIAAAAQLEAYARIMGLPMEVAVSGKELNKAIRKYSDYDRIFIDTAGRSPNSDQGNTDILNLFKDNANAHGYLVLSATTHFKNMLTTSERFENLPFHSYIFSKLDETEDLSPMINFLILKEKPVSYFTTGQQVPEDIEIASKKKMASLLLSGIKEKSHKVSSEGIYNGSSCRP
jgi:flagellar biosynthesis protein FlhF